MSTERIAVEVVLALPEQAFVVALEVVTGTTVLNAVERSRIADHLPSLVISECRFGVFGTLRAPETLVNVGDRIELYRPLSADPKSQRRRRAAAQQLDD